MVLTVSVSRLTNFFTMAKTEYRHLAKLLNGGIGGIVGGAAVFPLDLVKTRLQNQQVGPQGQKMYKNMVDAFIKTYKAEGVVGMYRGIQFSVTLGAPEKAIKLSSNDFFRLHLQAADGSLPIYKQMLAGALAGVCQTIVTTPMELLKIQMQDAGRIAAQARLEGRTITTKSGIQMVTDLINTHGVLGLYQGIRATIMRDVCFSIIYFPTFAALNELGPKRTDGSGDSVFWWSLVAGCMSACLAAFCVTPVDVVKTRLQSMEKSKNERAYAGVGDAFVKILQQEGPTGFFKGGVCRIIVISPMFGITQAVYYLGVAEYLLGYKK